uniref:Uncharacterized protein n=1 Tax=Rhizophora mucronata TaxID=61149 RepID=A0A2P2QVZ5_RHIMU
MEEELGQQEKQKEILGRQNLKQGLGNQSNRKKERTEMDC